MPGPYDPKLSRVRISATQTGVYANLGLSRGGGLPRDTEGATVLRWLGGELSRAGNKTLNGDISVWWDGDDTSQTVAESAYNNDTQVWLQIAPRGTLAGAKVFQFRATITSFPLNFDSTGDGVEGTIGYSGDASTLTVVTLA